MAADLRRLSKRLPAASDRAIRDWARWSYGIALAYSSGRVRQAVFDTPYGSEYAGRPGRYYRLSNYAHGAAAGLGHPYGHGSTGALGPRGPIPYGDPAKINVQSGAFFRGWKVQPGLSKAADRRAASRSWFLVNDSPHARDLLEGTRLMVRRPFLDRIADAARSRAAYYGAVALQDALR